MAILEEFIGSQMIQHGRMVPARLMSVMALLERLRTHPSLRIDDHIVGARTGVRSHNRFARAALARFGLPPPGTSHGRRSNQIMVWGQPLLDLMRDVGFEGSDAQKLIDIAQAELAMHVREIVDQKPLEVHVRGRSVHAVIQEVLDQAVATGKGGDVAQYLVGAKLELRLKIELPLHGANLPDSKFASDRPARPGDFEVKDAMFEVAIGPPDDKHIGQIVEALKNRERDVWLLTRNNQVSKWRKKIIERDDIDDERVVVSSVETFVGQNLAEIAGFSSEGKVHALTDLCRIYNERWIAGIGGTTGMTIELKE